MTRAYSDDLRRKLLEAFDQSKESLGELADRFAVCLGWTWKVSDARSRTGRSGAERRENIFQSSYRPALQHGTRTIVGSPTSGAAVMVTKPGFMRSVSSVDSTVTLTITLPGCALQIKWMGKMEQ
jgi:hypothetical protein